MNKQSSEKRIIKVYRQGDVNLIKVDEPKVFDEEIKADNGSTILAYGEVTNHAHRIPATHAKQFKLGGKEYVKVTKPTQLKHEEHFPINLPVGTYEKVIAREYDKIGGERKVVD